MGLKPKNASKGDAWLQKLRTHAILIAFSTPDFAQIAKSIHGVIDHIGTKSNPFARKT